MGSKITEDSDCNHEIRRWLLLGRKVMTNLNSVFKNRDITLPTKLHIVKATGFPVVMYGCGSWTIKKAEHLRADAFELWCWRRLLRVPWTTRRSSPSLRRPVLIVHWKVWCWSWNFNSLATWCEELTHWKWSWCWERLMAGGTGYNRGWDGWMVWPTEWTLTWANSRGWWGAEKPGVLQFMGLQIVRHNCGFNPWVPRRREWQPTPVFLLGKSHGQRSLRAYDPKGHKESGMTEATLNNKKN